MGRAATGKAVGEFSLADRVPVAARINGQIESSVPLNLFGRGYRWPGTNGRSHARIAAAVDAELGVGVLVESPDGVKAYAVPRCAR
jgi:hypothetical protein